MKLIDLSAGRQTTLSPEETVCCAIGNFDGVHVGHQELIRKAAARPDGVTKSAVWTFCEPSSRLLNRSVGLLTSMEERMALFRAMGIDLVFLEDFERVRNMDAHRFAEEVLFRECHVRTAVCGFNFRYGSHAEGTAETLSQVFHKLGAHVSVVPPCRIDGITVSSSEIRAAIAYGDMERASRMLGRSYSLTAEVVEGKHLGHKLGFPTINQRFPTNRALPRFGVYASLVTAEDRQYHGVSNVGVRPTVEHTDQVNCGTHVLDFDGDLYGKIVKVEFRHFLRPETKFENPAALQDAVRKNIAETRDFFHLMEGSL